MTRSSVYHADLAVVGGVVREHVTIHVHDGRFGVIACGDDAPPGSVRLAGLTLPSMANAHSHAFHRALRGRVQTDADDRGGSFWTWRELMYSTVDRLDPDNYFRLARATFSEMVLAGYTTVGEFHYLHHRPDGGAYDDPNAMGEAVLAAAAESGIRITLLDTLYLHGGFDTAGGYRSVEGAQARFSDGSVESWTARVDRLAASTGPSGTDRQRIGAALHSVRAVDPAAISAAASWASDRAVPMHAHVSEQPAENEACVAALGATPTAVLAGAGAVGECFTAVHATHLTDADISVLGRARAAVCFCPTTERDLGDGIGPSGLLAAAGTTLALGSDSHAVIDPFEESRALELDERLATGQRGSHPATSLLSMATSNGHRCLGWDDVGAIATSCRADLVTVSLDSVRTAGTDRSTALETALFAATAADVRDVIVDGEPVVGDGRHLRIDVPRALGDSIRELFAS